LTRVGEGAYCASAKAWQQYNTICLEAARFYQGLRPLSLAKLQELDDLLGNVVDSIQRSGVLGYRPSFELDLQLGKGDGPVLQRICSKLSAILAYRDDAYLNAWMTQEVNGYVWEAFTYVYQGKAKNVREIASRLAGIRQYDLHRYQQALDFLQEKGWVCLRGANYEPTDAGIKVIAEVARSLNQFFYTPWLDFEESEIIRLKELLEDLSGSLQGEKPAYGSGYAHLNRTLGWGTVQWARDKA
jgi:hypothetical protein